MYHKVEPHFDPVPSSSQTGSMFQIINLMASAGWDPVHISNEDLSETMTVELEEIVMALTPNVLFHRI
jgi:hypothetical protein